jgi:hypothetical protein
MARTSYSSCAIEDTFKPGHALCQRQGASTISTQCKYRERTEVAQGFDDYRSGTLTGPVGHPWQQAEDPSYALEEPNTSVDFYEEAGRNIRNYKADILLVLDSDASEEALHELEVAMATVDADVKLYKERYENNIGKCIEMHGEI